MMRNSKHDQTSKTNQLVIAEISDDLHLLQYLRKICCPSLLFQV